MFPCGSKKTPLEGELKMIKIFLSIFLALTVFAIAGCGSVGKPFDSSLSETIVEGQTTQAEILTKFGEPFKKGTQNGDLVWVYEYNEYKGSGNSLSKNLTLVFDRNNIVKSRQTMSTAPRS